MSEPSAKQWMHVAVGCVLGVLYVAVALACMLATSSPEHILTSAPSRTRMINLVPYAVLALSLLAVGLSARRWWQAPLAPVLLVAGGFWWLTWLMNFPRHIAEHNWTAARATDVADLLGTAWHVVATAMVIVGWGLVRREGWWWTLGLLPSALLIGMAELVERGFRPDSSHSGAGGLEAAVRATSHDIRVYQAIAIVLTTLTVAGSVWLCVLAEKRLPDAFQPKPLVPARPGAVRPGAAPLQAPHAAGAPSSVADEIRKLADLRNAGELTDTEFEIQKSRLLG